MSARGPEAKPAEAPRPASRREPDAPPEDPIIAKAKESAESFTETLPNYICQQFTARFVNTSHITSWQAQDVVSAEVVYENGKESYRNLAINGKPIKKGMEELSGSWSTGEFGTLLRDVFSPATAAQFRYRKDAAIAGMSAGLYDFQVERDHSHWRIQVASQSYFPAYKGSVWIEKKAAGCCASKCRPAICRPNSLWIKLKPPPTMSTSVSVEPSSSCSLCTPKP